MKKISLFLLFFSINFAHAMDVPENAIPIVQMPEKKKLAKILKNAEFKAFDKKTKFSKLYGGEIVNLKNVIQLTVNLSSKKTSNDIENFIIQTYNPFLINNLFEILLPHCSTMQEPDEEN